jgi:hypothetical protein
LQIINAIEAIEHFKLENNVLVLIYGASDLNKIQMQNLIKQEKWKKIIHIENRYKSKYFQYVNLIKELKEDRYKYLFVGELGSLHRIVIPNVAKEKVFLLDDGTATVEYYNNLIKVDRYNRYNFKELRFLFFGLKVKIRDKVNLFTYFDLKPVHGIEVVKNKLNYLKIKYLKDAKKDENTIYFIGLPVEPSNVITMQMYRNILFNIVKKFEKKIIYIPHRLESQNFIKELSSINNPMIEVKIINQPIEMYLLENKIYPSHVISYFSTALTTLGIIYEGSEINIIKVPQDDVNIGFFNLFLREYYENSNQKQFITYDDLGIQNDRK